MWLISEVRRSGIHIAMPWQPMPDPERPESRIVLLERARRLHPSKMIDQDKVWAGVRG